MKTARLSSLTTRTKTIAVDLGDDVVIEVEYRPRALNYGTAQAIAQAESEGNQLQIIDFILDTILSTVVTWGLLDDDDRPMPLTKESLKKLPVEIPGMIYGAINRDLRPNLENGANSSPS